MARAVAVIAGGETLLGKEIQERVSELPIPVEARPIDTGGGDDDTGVTGRLTRLGDEPALMPTLNERSLAGADVIFLAGGATQARVIAGLVAKQSRQPTLIDVSFALEDEPASRLRAPTVEPPETPFEPGTIQQIAHPAAITLAMFLNAIGPRGPIARSIVHVFEPASERGRAGVEELQSQTVNLLSFKPLKKEIFDVQLSFNMLASYGEEAALALDAVEERIESHLASLLANTGRIPLPSLKLIQAPVFHGYSMSAWVEFSEPPEVTELATLLEAAGADVRGTGDEPPNNAGIANQSGIAVGGIQLDRNNSRAVWFWIVADNLRLVADNAVMTARPLLEGGALA